MLRPLALAAFALTLAGQAHAQAPEPAAIPTAVGMVEEPCPPGSSGRSEAALAYARAVVTDGPMDSKALAGMGAEGQQRAAMDAWSAKNDWANLCLYRQANAADVKAGPVKVVFLGNSITELWKAADPDLFTGGIVDRGISGQTSGQTLIRFMPDVVALHPKAVHIVMGTNDVAGNNGPTRAEDLQNNIRAMVAIAKANHIRVILGAITPAGVIPWRNSIHPTEQIKALNAWMKAYAAQEGLIYVDYWSALAGPDGAMKPGISRDGVHPMRSGYALMKPLALAAIKQALAR